MRSRAKTSIGSRRRRKPHEVDPKVLPFRPRNSVERPGSAQVGLSAAPFPNGLRAGWGLRAPGRRLMSTCGLPSNSRRPVKIIRKKYTQSTNARDAYVFWDRVHGGTRNRPLSMPFKADVKARPSRILRPPPVVAQVVPLSGVKSR
jgi:hypothetical protein